MALFECGECRGKVSDTADKCPHCGAPVAKAAVLPPVIESVPEKKGGVLKWVLGLPAGLFVLVMVIGGIASRNTPDSHYGYEDRVKKQLIDPDSARFSGVEKYDGGAVCGYVNSKNRMGGFVGDRGFLQKANGGVFIDDGTPVGHGTFILMRQSVCHHGPETEIQTAPISDPQGAKGEKKKDWPSPTTVSGYQKPVSGKPQAKSVAPESVPAPAPVPAPQPVPPAEPVKESNVKGWPAPPAALDGAK